MTQPDSFVSPERSQYSKPSNLWIAGAVVLGVVFVPALIAGLVSLIIH